MAKKWLVPKTRVIWVECDLMQYENKVETTKGIYSFNFQGENSFKGVQKPSQKDHLPLNAAYVGL